MNITDKLFDFQKYFEGVHQTPYLDTGGVLTIGIGHTDRNKYYFDSESVWTMDEVYEAWSIDLDHSIQLVEDWVSAPLTQDQFEVSVDLVFNAGRPNTYIKMLNEEDYDGARQQLLRWIYDNGKVQLGLVKRCFARYMYFAGEDYSQILETPLNSKNLCDFNEVIDKLGYQIIPDPKTRFILQRIA